jgi:nitroimidazol reductase NimA-like FMN-containing flavoprotein (pyridoxamine 5'-phosphate oxidase superfamily)
MLTPSRRRPDFAPDYGINEEPDGMLDWAWAEERLARARTFWIVTSDENGRPRAAPVWGVWFDDAVVFGTNPRSRKGMNLGRDSRVLIHLDSGDEAVILEGQAEAVPPRDEIADAYNAKYGWRPDLTDENEGWYRLRPRLVQVWIESDYATTATRFDF